MEPFVGTPVEDVRCAPPDNQGIEVTRHGLWTSASCSLDSLPARDERSIASYTAECVSRRQNSQPTVSQSAPAAESKW
jgi:hypothetical protein